MLTTVLSTRQPRWVLLSVFLVLWSWCPSLRRDGRLKAFGFGVEAQVGIPLCAVECASQEGDALGCGEGLNLACACHSETFLPSTVTCMDHNCTSTDEQLGQIALQSACASVGNITSTAQSTSTPGSSSSTSITSGVPPISRSTTSSSGTSSQATTTVTVTTTPSSTSVSATSSSTAVSTSTSVSSSASVTTVTTSTTSTFSPTSATSSQTSLSTSASSASNTTTTVTQTPSATNNSTSPNSASAGVVGASRTAVWMLLPVAVAAAMSSLSDIV